MHRYRTHHTSTVTEAAIGSRIRLAGWTAKKRDHHGVVFLDLRDAHGTLQLVVEADSAAFTGARSVSLESVVCVTGKLVRRSEESRNARLLTGQVELRVEDLEVLSAAAPLPFAVDSSKTPEELRLKHRYLDLRGTRQRSNLELRSALIQSLRRRMLEAG